MNYILWVAGFVVLEEDRRHVIGGTMDIKIATRLTLAEAIEWRGRLKATILVVIE